MEIPDNLKKLYKHWKFHTQKPNIKTGVALNQEVLIDMYPFISERMRIWEKRQVNESPPYTKDVILANYRFCNIYRELDRQTIELHSQLKQLENNFDLWLLNVLFYRMVCKPETISKVGLLTYDSKNNEEVKDKLLNLERPKYGVAYIFPISLVKKVDCANREEFFCDYLPKVTKQCANIIEKLDKSSVVSALEKVLPAFGLNFKFHWTEVLIDVAYQYPQYIDLYNEFPIGPGSIPTMLRLNNLEQPEKTCQSLVGVEIPDFPYLTYEGKTVWLSGENWEGIGCEFRKYTNLLTGVGRKRIYKSRSIRNNIQELPPKP
jgi:hypothetical protein